jgi:hypothetical protein
MGEKKVTQLSGARGISEFIGTECHRDMLILIKTIHTIIWAIMAGSNFLAFYCALTGRFDAWFWVPASLITLEIFIIVLNRWRCPITKIAAQYTQERQANFDIYLPEWLARHNVRIFSILIVAEILIVLAQRLV